MAATAAASTVADTKATETSSTVVTPKVYYHHHDLNAMHTFTGPQPKDGTAAHVIKYSVMCIQNNPCKHYVDVDGSNMGCMRAPDICRLFTQYGIPIPKHLA